MPYTPLCVHTDVYPVTKNTAQASSKLDYLIKLGALRRPMIIFCHIENV